MQCIRLTLRPQSTQAAPGEQLTFSLTLENSSSLTYDVTMRVTGLPRQAYTLDESTVSIPPDDATLVHLSVQLPTDAVAGRYPFRVQLTAEDNPALRASAIAELVVVRAAAAPQVFTTTVEGAAPVARHGQIDPAPSAPDLARSGAPSWRRSGRARPARVVAVLGLVALLGLLGVATTRGLAHLAFPPAAPTRQPAVAPRPTLTEPPPSTIAAPATQQQPRGVVRGIVAPATPVTATPRPAATATPFVITIGP